MISKKNIFVIFLKICNFVFCNCGSGEIGRHAILRGWCRVGVRVQVPPSAQRKVILIE